MSYAVIKTGGKQYKVKSGEILKIEKLPDSKPDSKIEFNEILAYGDDKTIEIGTPTVEGAKVEADLIKNGKDRTILIFKKRRRQNSRRKNGHRQEHTMIRINKIFSKDGKVLSEAEKIEKLRENGISTIPSTLKEELECNIFLRAKDVKTFSKLRDLKDNF